MPSEIQAPSTTPSIDRLTLAVSEARGGESATTGPCGTCRLCTCVEAE